MQRIAGSAAILALAIAFLAGCSATSHPVAPSALGSPSSTSLDAVADQPGPVEVETVVGCDWEVPLSGLLDLKDLQAKAAGLTDRSERIQVVFHVLRHPTRGTFIVDTGVERALFDAPSDAAVRGIVASYMDVDKMKRRVDTATWIAGEREPVRGVFLTHLHLDHVSGLRDIPAGTPVYVGPGEARDIALVNVVVAPTTNRALEGKPALSEWHFGPDRDGRFEGVLDVFGDASVWALYVPGHTKGSTAFLVRTPRGPVLLTGDASHTTWGWEHGVPPGTFTEDRSRNKASLARLRAFVAAHPTTRVLLGHQGYEAEVSSHQR